MELLNKGGVKDTLAAMYKQLCQTPDTLIDTLLKTTSHFTPLRAPQQSDAEAALQWLKSRGKVKKGYSADSLLLPLTH